MRKDAIKSRLLTYLKGGIKLPEGLTLEDLEKNGDDFKEIGADIIHFAIFNDIVRKMIMSKKRESPFSYHFESFTVNLKTGKWTTETNYV